ncbi:MAG: RNA polymerase-binding protein DksA [Nevskiaceae bacterium]|nr:MAG: RNA polymerase-binding protein DksA [Nevskiaceae bacterium]TBR71477.1 MAG: RNA polymerase-binding protein DksA [Nevskiaceae bacterium]
MATKTTPHTTKQAPARTATKKAPSRTTPPRPATGKTQSATKAPASSIVELTEEKLRAMSEADYMNAAQLAFFRARLLVMREEVLDREIDAKERLVERENFADPADRATAEENHWLDLRLRERESRLLSKIDGALQLIRTGEYGYCQKTGEPIGIPRLLARPTATVCVDVKDQSEKIETHFRDN